MIIIVSYLSLPSSTLHPAKFIILKFFLQYITLPESQTPLQYFSLRKFRVILFKKCSLKSVESILSTVLSETITNEHHSRTVQANIHQEQ
jgi:hypothetical protein